MTDRMTMTEKILAAHAGLESVGPGEMIKVHVDLALANDITAPLAIRVFNEMGKDTVFDPEKIALVADHFVPNKDLPSAEQAKMMRQFALRHRIQHYCELGDGGLSMSSFLRKAWWCPATSSSVQIAILAHMVRWALFQLASEARIWVPLWRQAWHGSGFPPPLS